MILSYELVVYVEIHPLCRFWIVTVYCELSNDLVHVEIHPLCGLCIVTVYCELSYDLAVYMWKSTHYVDCVLSQSIVNYPTT